MVNGAFFLSLVLLMLLKGMASDSLYTGLQRKRKTSFEYEYLYIFCELFKLTIFNSPLVNTEFFSVAH